MIWLTRYARVSYSMFIASRDDLNWTSPRGVLEVLNVFIEMDRNSDSFRATRGCRRNPCPYFPQNIKYLVFRRWPTAVQDFALTIALLILFSFFCYYFRFFLLNWPNGDYSSPKLRI